MRPNPKRIFITGLLLAWAPVLFLGAIGYIHVALPMAEKIVVDEARIAAAGVDGLVRTRNTALSLAVADVTLDKILEPGRLDRLVDCLRGHFPDFLSIEVIDAGGEVAAMAGEIPLGKDGLILQPETPRFAPRTLAGDAGEWTFRDNPAKKCFYIAQRRDDGGYPAWLVRARFSRSPLESVMAAASADAGYTARLVPVGPSESRAWSKAAGKGSEGGVKPGGPGAIPVHVVGNWGSGLWTAEAPVSAPGWQIVIESDPMGTVRAYAAALLAVALVLHVLIVPVLLRMGREEAPAGSDGPTARVARPTEEDGKGYGREAKRRDAARETFGRDVTRENADSDDTDHISHDHIVEGFHAAVASEERDTLLMEGAEEDSSVGEAKESVETEAAPREIVDFYAPDETHFNVTCEIEETAGMTADVRDIVEVDGPPLLLEEARGEDNAPETIDLSWEEPEDEGPEDDRATKASRWRKFFAGV